MNQWIYIGLGGLLIGVAIFAACLIPQLSELWFKFKMGVIAGFSLILGILLMVYGPKIADNGQSYRAHQVQLTHQYHHAINEMKQNTHDQSKYNYWNAQAQSLKQQLDDD